MTPRDERWLVTGALGCIGSWVVRVLLDEGATVTTLDLHDAGHRLDLVVGAEHLDRVDRRAADIRDLDAVLRVVAESGATHIVHLAALQIPFCKADPSLGAQVNVVGTVNVFEAASRSEGAIRGISYASSAAAYDALETPEVGAHGDLAGVPSTLYGVFKRANEGTAQVYWHDHGVASVGLRPHTVYGVGRDQGLTSQPTQAMLAAARGAPYRIEFGGAVPMQFAGDVAADFIAAARASDAGAPVVNVPGSLVEVRDIVDAIAEEVPASAGAITFDEAPLPFPGDLPVDTSVVPFSPRTSLRDGVHRTIEQFRGAGMA